ncbi:MAG: hypothetical protein VKJ04_12060 [Vampirovibrionales bacterium]|nr:hypothetical protein [Vampirovibrionales bacterium]
MTPPDAFPQKTKKPAVFFQTDETPSSLLPASVRPGSLTDLIARHLEQPKPQEAQKETLAGGFFETQGDSQTVSYTPFSQTELYLYEKAYAPSSQALATGIHINQLDGQMPSGVEHLLPSAKTRYSVMKRRLEAEMSSLKASLRDYKALIASTSPANRPKLAAEAKSLQARLYVLERRHAKACVALEGIDRKANPFRQQIKESWQQLGEMLTSSWQGFSFAQLEGKLRTREQTTLSEAYLKVKEAQTLLEAELSRPTPHSETVSALVFQYERLLGQYQRLLGQASKSKKQSPEVRLANQ